MTLAGNSAWTIYGGVTVTSFASRTYNGAITFAATSSVVLNFGSMTFATNFTFSGVGTWTLGSAFSTTGTINLTNGTLDTSSSGNYALTTSAITLQAGTKTLNLNTSAITITGTSLNLATNATGFTLNAGTSTITLSGAVTGFSTSNLTFYNVSFTNTSLGTVTFSTGSNTFNNLTFTAKASVVQSSLVFANSQTINGTLTIPGGLTTGSYRWFVRSQTLGTPITLTANAVSLIDCDFRDIVGSGAASWSGTRLGDCGGNSGITFPAAKTVYWNLAGSNNWNATAWATTPSGTPLSVNFPLPQDTAVFTDNNPAASSVVTGNAAYNIGTIDFSARTLALTWNIATSFTAYGDTILSAAIAPSNGTTITYSGRGNTQTITSAGRTWTQALTVQNIGGTVRLSDAWIGSNGATLNNGTLDLNGFNLTCSVFLASNTNTRTIAFGALGGQITVTANSTVWTTATTTGLSITGTDPKIYVTNSTASATTVSPGTTVGISSLLSFYFTAGTYALTISAGSLFNNLDFTGYAGTVGGTTRSVYGDLKLSTGMTLTAGASATTFASTTTGKTITSNGRTMDFPLTFNGVGGSWILQDAMTVGSTRNINLTNGTLDLNGFACTSGSMSTGVGTKNLTFNGSTLTLAGATTPFTNNNPTNFTTTAGTGTGTISITNSAGTNTFAGGGSTFNCTLNQASSQILSITGNNTFSNITNTVSPTTVRFFNGNVTTVANFNLNGTAGNLVTINTGSAGVSSSLIKTGGGVVSCDYLSLQDSAATPSTLTWYAGTHSTNVSGNSGWIFTAPPITSTNFLLFF